MQTKHLSYARTSRRFLFASVIYLAFSQAHAASEPGTQELMFSDVDRNHDGVIDLEEARVYPELFKLFKQADTNHDGVLSEKEFNALIHPAS